VRCAEEDSNLHPVSPDQALKTVGAGPASSDSCGGVGWVHGGEQIGRLGHIGCVATGVAAIRDQGRTEVVLQRGSPPGTRRSAGDVARTRVATSVALRDLAGTRPLPSRDCESDDVGHASPATSACADVVPMQAAASPSRAATCAPPGDRRARPPVRASELPSRRRLRSAAEGMPDRRRTTPLHHDTQMSRGPAPVAAMPQSAVNVRAASGSRLAVSARSSALQL